MSGHLTGKLTQKFVNSCKEAGRYGDGSGLYLLVQPSGTKSWILRVVVKGKRADIGLGGLSYTPLQEARRKAYDLRAVARNGGDPRVSSRKKVIPTFEELALEVHDGRKDNFKNAKHAQQWINTLTQYAFAEIGNMSVDIIDSADVLKVISPIWATKHETAKRTMQRISTVMDVAKARKFRAGENPVSEVKALNVLPKIAKKVKHHAAIPWKDLPDFYAELCGKESMAALALRMTILTGCRTGEILGLQWSEIDRDAKTLTIPAERYKTNQDHDVPLCSEALAILDAVEGVSTEYVFEGQRKDKPLSNMAMEMQLRRMKRDDITVHGMRSTMRDWCSDHGIDRVLAEAMLGHSVGQNAVERAYARSSMIERRRVVADQYSAFVTGRDGAGNVVALNG